MNSQNYDSQIEKYLNGSMGPSEERNFLIQVKADPQFARLLHAEKIVKSGLNADNAKLSADHPELYARFLSSLSGVTAPVQSSARAARRFYWLPLLLGFLLLCGSGYMFLRFMRSETVGSKLVLPQPGLIYSTDAGKLSQPEAPATVAEPRNNSALHAKEGSVRVATPAVDAPVKFVTHSPRQTLTATAPRAVATSAPANNTAKPASIEGTHTKTVENEDAINSLRSNEPPRVFTNDSVRTNVNFKSKE